MTLFPEVTNTLLRVLTNSGYEAYYVGGCVRDALLKRETFDIDICCSAPLDVIEGLVSHYNYEIEVSLGALSFHVKPYNITITKFRQEANYDGRRPHSVSFDCSIEDDLKRRDFTINTLLYDLDKGIIDLLGGVDDLRNGILRAVGDPHIKFQEDYVRMLRLMRFKSQLNFEVEPHTWEAAKEHYPLLKKYSNRVWRDEFFKWLVSEGFVKHVLSDAWTLTTLFKELDDALNFDQENPYHKYSLYEHTLYVVDNLKGLNLRLVGLFHDLGKLETKIYKERQRASYPNHAKVGSRIAKGYLESWELSKTQKDWILKLIEYHDMSLSDDYIEFKKKVHQFGLEFMEDIVVIKRADNIAKSDLALYQLDKCDVLQGYIQRIKTEQPILQFSELKIKGSDLSVEGSKRRIILEMLMNGVIEGTLINEYDVLKKEAERLKHELYPS